jgi:hypothetical protein
MVGAGGWEWAEAGGILKPLAQRPGARPVTFVRADQHGLVSGRGLCARWAFRAVTPEQTEATEPVSFYRLQLVSLDGTFAVAKLPSDAAISSSATRGLLFSITGHHRLQPGRLGALRTP